jgi:choline dehydrogenase-like flavoprotein
VETPDLIVIGSGGAAMAAGIAARGEGRRVLLVERALVGGTCLNIGCVPSKALLAASGQPRRGHGGRLHGPSRGDVHTPTGGQCRADREASAGGGSRLRLPGAELTRRIAPAFTDPLATSVGPLRVSASIGIAVS